MDLNRYELTELVPIIARRMSIRPAKANRFSESIGLRQSQTFGDIIVISIEYLKIQGQILSMYVEFVKCIGNLS